MELLCGVEWEPSAVDALRLIETSHVSYEELVLFVETSSASPVKFSTELLGALMAVGGVLECYSSFEP